MNLEFKGKVHAIELHYGEFKCDDNELKETIEISIINVPINGYLPNIDAYYSREILKVFKGEVTHQDEYDYDENVIY